jgi:hypothetical protein
MAARAIFREQNSSENALRKIRTAVPQRTAAKCVRREQILA